MRRRALTLSETVISMFLLVGGFLVVTQVFHGSLRYSSRIELRLTASLIAENKMAEIRAWAKIPANFDNPGSIPKGQDPLRPEYKIVVDNPVDQEIFSPSSAMAPTRSMKTSLKKVKVTVESPGGERVTLVSVVGDPLRTAATVVVTPGTASVSPGGPSAMFTAVARDSGGQPIRDVFFNWSVRPEGWPPGNGHVLPGPEGPPRQAGFRNEVVLLDGSIEVPPAPRGQCRLEARTRTRTGGGTPELSGSAQITL